MMFRASIADMRFLLHRHSGKKKSTPESNDIGLAGLYVIVTYDCVKPFWKYINTVRRLILMGIYTHSCTFWHIMGWHHFRRTMCVTYGKTIRYSKPATVCGWWWSYFVTFLHKILWHGWSRLPPLYRNVSCWFLTPTKLSAATWSNVTHYPEASPPIIVSFQRCRGNVRKPFINAEKSVNSMIRISYIPTQWINS